VLVEAATADELSHKSGLQKWASLMWLAHKESKIVAFVKPGG
jgi:hypothetical protein